MEPVLFYGVPSGCSLASIIALEWLGRPYRLSRVEMMEQPWPSAFARINPKMKTPALVLGDGDTLTESLAILMHIARRGQEGSGTTERIPSRAAGAKSPDDGLAEMLAYLTTDFFSAFGPLWLAYESGELDAGSKAMLRKLGETDVRREFAYLNRHLAKKDWLLGGEVPTVADAYLYAVARWADYHDMFNLEREYPEVFRLLSKLRQEPAVQFAVAIENGEDVRGNGAFLGHVTLQDALK